MRPHVSVDGANEFECVGCGRRVESPATRRCSECEGRLLNVGADRDL